MTTDVRFQSKQKGKPDSLTSGSVCTLLSPPLIELAENYLFQCLIAIETGLIPTLRYATPSLFKNDYEFIVHLET